MTLRLLLKCSSVEETKSFYEEILDFQVFDSAEGTCTVQKGDGSIIFTEKDLWSGHPKCTGTIYFFLSDVDAYFESINPKAIVRWPLETMPYGTREFGLKDCNQYTLAFAEEI